MERTTNYQNNMRLIVYLCIQKNGQLNTHLNVNTGHMAKVKNFIDLKNRNGGVRSVFFFSGNRLKERERDNCLGVYISLH